jgi:hypothetical protein
MTTPGFDMAAGASREENLLTLTPLVLRTRRTGSGTASKDRNPAIQKKQLQL